MNNFGYIYQITNTKNNKSYIGYTKDLFNRMKSHYKNYAKIENPKIKNSKLYRAFRKYEINNFIVKILEQPRIAELGKREEYYINLFHTFMTGYNSTKGNDGGDTFTFNTIEQKQKIRQRAREAGKGRRASAQAKYNMSEAQRGHPGYTKGQKRSEEFKEKCRLRMINNQHSLLPKLNIDDVVKLRNNGKTIKEIAIIFGRSYGYVYNYLKAQNKTKRRFDLDEHYDQIVKLLHQGHSTHKIAQIFCCSESAIRNKKNLIKNFKT